ncbi:MAG: globin [Phenylobacterium sp.]|uniref:globin n=1 Tax=Phenylobacterium sp. TaxID=1871053 RepID=UPI0025F17BE0|nr:globin [Phenylobacterium sp.]MBI1196654.1 globin [Phenylobacterium sp.]
MSEAAELVANSLELVAERIGDPAPQVFARLFAEFPDAEERFARDVTGAVRGEMLAMVFGVLMDPDGPYQANLVKTERVNHDGFGTPSHEFDRFFDIVRDTCREALGVEWTDAFDAAWTRQIATVLAVTK